MHKSTDVVIIGGGIIGCSIAYRLKQIGIQCIVLDKGDIGAQASSAAVGLLAPLRTFSERNDPYTRLLFESLSLFPDVASELMDVTGLDIEFQKTGTIRVYNETKKVIAPWIETWTSSGFRAQWISSKKVQSFEPVLSLRARTILYVPDESQVNTRKYVSAMVTATRELGVDLLSHQEVIEVRSSDQKVEAVVTAQGDIIHCGKLIIAAGCWSNSIAQLIGLSLPVFPKRGQVISLRQPTTPLRHIVFSDEVYLAPKKDGTILVGATADDAGYNTHVTAEGLLWLLSKAVKVVPVLRDCSVENAWAGLRPKTSDSRPILGLAPQWKNVILATGHNGFGITLSAITAKEIVQLVQTGMASPMIQPFGMDRFPMQSVKNDVAMLQVS